MGRSAIFVLLCVAAAFVFALACGQAANGTDACTSIEHARCNWIEACFDAGNYGLPTRRSDETSPVDDCNRFYNDACLHGLVTSVAVSAAEVTACVTAINNATDCTIVTNPETADACAFLVPSDAGLDADGE